MGQTDRQMNRRTVGRQTVTLRLRLDAASIIMQAKQQRTSTNTRVRFSHKTVRVVAHLSLKPHTTYCK